MRAWVKDRRRFAPAAPEFLLDHLVGSVFLSRFKQMTANRVADQIGQLQAGQVLLLVHEHHLKRQPVIEGIGPVTDALENSAPHFLYRNPASGCSKKPELHPKSVSGDNQKVGHDLVVVAGKRFMKRRASLAPVTDNPFIYQYVATNMLLMIDNYDSFTYNLVQYLGELGAEVVVHRNDKVTAEQVADLSPSHIVISPGPCTPNEAGVSLEVVTRFAGKVPILGVCLGHQCIGQAFGGRIVHAGKIMHGKTSMIHHLGEGVFRDLEAPFEATRYHSLVVDGGSLPDLFEVTAWTLADNGEREEIMGLRHRELPVSGVQFHPESILTEHGHQLLRNFLEQA